MTNNVNQTIAITCASKGVRPRKRLEEILTGTRIAIREPFAKSINSCTWDFSDVSTERWNDCKKLLIERINELKDSGKINNGSCS